ncbi:MAG: EAL domain-containing protein [Burkholderiales bacterium]|nr:EAL domain-containing protein [Burkholderiales bacterium]
MSSPPPIPCDDCQCDAALGFQFEFAFQPIVDLSTGRVFAQEALVRGPGGESAASVLSAVNDSNRYKFDQACRVKAVKGAKRLGIDTLDQYVSINFLPNAVYEPERCIRTTLEAAKASEFPLSRIIFEVTEVEKIQDRAHLAGIIKAYKTFGFLTAIDDFGAGYSGLNLLAEYQPDLIKIDMELVRGIESSRPKRAILSGILSVCEELGIRVIAEGIETRAERDCLLDAGIELMQGYFFAQPAFRALATVEKSHCLT